jgi:hypothetical protein
MARWHCNFMTFSTSAFVALTAQNLCAQEIANLKSFKSSIQSATDASHPYKTKFGNTLNVYQLPAAITGHNQPNKRFLIQGGLHGNELLGSDFVIWLGERIQSGNSPLNSLNGGRVEFDLIPYANPDGTVLYARYNANHINLNRNFGVLWGITKENPGTAPFSEIETQGIRALFNKRNYTSAVDVHGYVNWVVAPTPADKGIKGLPKQSNQDLQTYKKWISSLQSAVTSKLPNYEFKTAGELGDGGAFEDYAWWSQKVLAYCLELKSSNRFESNFSRSRIWDAINPNIKSLGSAPGNQKNDLFIVYEEFIAHMFQKALDISNENTPKTASTH